MTRFVVVIIMIRQYVHHIMR